MKVRPDTRPPGRGSGGPSPSRLRRAKEQTMPRTPAAGEVWLDDLTRGPERPMDWIWHGMIAPRNTTLLTGPAKSGKTTLLSILLGLRVAGGELGGHAVKPGTT